jgi:hypothetical protein
VRERAMHLAVVPSPLAGWSLSKEAKDHANEGKEVGERTE